MGVFARLLRRSKATEEASAAEAPVGTPAAAEPTAEEGVADQTAQAKGSAGSEDAVEEATKPVVDSAAEAVDIPKQQSVAEAADSEAGESART